SCHQVAPVPLPGLHGSCRCPGERPAEQRSVGRWSSSLPRSTVVALATWEIAMDDSAETAFLAGGCAWIMQSLLSQPEGVISTRAGWMGGHGQNPTEENDGGPAETIEVVFDPDRLSYRGLLEVFFQVHRADLAEDVVGSIYRS